MMRAGLLILAAFAGTSLCVSAPAHAATPAKAQAADWTRVVARTVDGGFPMGNPAAKVKLVEYGSLTCPHCAHFAEDSTPGLRNYIQSGKVSYEYRNFVLNSVDVAATLLARCGGPKGFFAIADALYASQSQWVGAVEGLSTEMKAQLAALPEAEQLARTAEIGGLYSIASKGGVTAAKARICFAAPAGVDELQRIVDHGVELGVKGTPTFFLNGRKLDGSTWATVEPDVRDAIRAGG